MRLDGRAYRVPTDAPEADGTLAWSSTTMVMVDASHGGATGAGWTYGPDATAGIVGDLLAPAVQDRCAKRSPTVTGWHENAGAAATVRAERRDPPEGEPMRTREIHHQTGRVLVVICDQGEAGEPVLHAPHRPGPAGRLHTGRTAAARRGVAHPGGVLVTEVVPEPAKRVDPETGSRSSHPRS